MSDDGLPESDRIDGVPHPRETIQLYGQEKAEADFLEAYNGGRMHHSWLITGPKGVGKATLAWNIARFLLAQDNNTGMFGTPAESLHIPPEHPVFHRIASLGEPGLFLCRRPWDEKKKRLKTAITVEEVRKLKSFFNLSAADGGWRVAIVDAADEMNKSAENALLKVLEEPPEKTLIMLICHQPAKLLPTIRSRCRELKCSSLQPDVMENILTQAELDVGGNAMKLAELSGGSVGDAVDLLASDGLDLYDEIIATIATAPRMNRTRILQMADKCAARGAETRYSLTLRLTMLALSRLALAGAKGGSSSAIRGEGELAARLSSNPHQAQEWAKLVQEISGRTTHARAVNLDPAQVILDTFLSIDATAGKASRLSA